MKNFLLPFTRIENADEFLTLASKAGCLMNDEHVIQLSNNLGHGTVKRWHLDAGLYMRVWDVVFQQPVNLYKEAPPVYKMQNGYSLICILTPESVDLKRIDQHQQFSHSQERNMVLVPDAIHVELQVHAQRPVQIIDFAIASYWFRQQTGFAGIAKFFEKIAERGGIPVLIEPFSSKSSQAAGKLLMEAEARNYQLADMLTQSVSLITAFLQTAERTDKTTAHHDVYYKKIMMAEMILMNHLQRPLPKLSLIAQQVALSESTLKRYFKQVYGRSIYEYYLGKKMEKARRLLIENAITVNEAAEMMGYEKVSNFIDIFKKYLGCSPGSIRKSSLAAAGQCEVKQ